MIKRLTGLLTATAMIAAILAGCGESKKAEEAVELFEPAAEPVEAQDPASEIPDIADLSDKKIGICIYDFEDDYMTLFKGELEKYLLSQGIGGSNIIILDGAGDQPTQTHQVQDLIRQKVDAIIVNPVNSSSASIITDLVVSAGIPLVYINREPDADEESRWEENDWDVTYVGCDARQSGTMQGEIIVDLGQEKVDLNGDGKIQYIMIKGDPENVDARYRTEFSVKALEDYGWMVECLDEQQGNWDEDEARQLVADSLSAHPGAEVVFCNNDAMALGALDSIEEAGLTVGEDIFLVGVDALKEALADVIKGRLTGTVFNDHIAQSHGAADAAINYIIGAGNEHYIGCDYVKVTADNAQSVLDSLR